MTAGSVADRRALRRWTAEARRSWEGDPPEPTGVVAAVVVAIADRLGIAAPPDACRDASATVPDLPPSWCTPRLPGLLYEGLADPIDRRARGGWFTPPAIVDRLVDVSLGGGFEPAQVLDPACGGGAFLLGVADALHGRGLDPLDVVRRLEGVDLDPGAVAVARWSLDLWLGVHGQPPGAGRFTVGDGLRLPMEPSDLVLGNPPFGTPLRSARSSSPCSTYREASPHLGPYADDAACFLDRASGLVRPGGRLVLVLPLSLLTARDVAGVRDELSRCWDLVGLWVPGRPVFEAAVHVFAPVLRHPGGRPTGGVEEVALYAGREVAPAGRARPGGTWADAAADALGLPSAPTPGATTGPRLGELVSATSGFRQQHYGLAAACREAADGPGGAPVVTVGQIGPLSWDRDRSVRLGGRDWSRPVVDVEALPVALGSWVRRQLRPKILLATQSRLLEPLLDRTGDLVPSTPVIAVHTEAHNLDRVAAVLLAPPVVAWAARRSVGSALDPGAITLAARHVLDIPLPGDVEAWEEAASQLADVDTERPVPVSVLETVARSMCRAYRQDDAELWEWWHQRLTATRRTVSSTTGRIGG